MKFCNSSNHVEGSEKALEAYCEENALVVLVETCSRSDLSFLEVPIE